jgi:DNA repair photolyase
MRDNTKSFTREAAPLTLKQQNNSLSQPRKKIISASRRTDIPAFYADWFIDRLRCGLFRYKNPFGGNIVEQKITPDECLGIVFWTRFPEPIKKHIPDLQKMGYKFYFHFTITGYPKVFETHNPSLDKAISCFKDLSDRISPDLVFWRYDPIIFSSITSMDYHLRQFEKLCKALHGFTHRCYISFADYYGKTIRNFWQIINTDDVLFYEPTIEQQISLSEKLYEIGKTYNIKLYACCTDIIVGENIEKASCVEDEVLRRLYYPAQPPLKPKLTREQCGCKESVDIGTYDSCLFGCRYCYATRDRNIALGNYRNLI